MIGTATEPNLDLPTGFRREKLAAVVCVAAAFTLSLVRLLSLVAGAAVNLPFEDQWNLLTPLFEDRGVWAFFRWQHGPHRQGLGGVVDWFLYQLTHWDVRAESWTCAVCVVLAAILAVWLSVRLRGKLHWSDAAYPLLFINGMHWETMLLTPNVAHSILPLLLVMGIACACALDPSFSRAVWITLLSGLSLFTGFGFCAALAVTGLVLVLLILPRPENHFLGRIERYVLSFGLLLAYGIFAVDYRWDTAVPGWYFPVTPVWNYPHFVGLMFTSFLGWRQMGLFATCTGAVVAGLVVVVFLMLTGSIARRTFDKVSAAVWVLVATSLGYAALTAVGRLPVSIEAAFMWRYTTLLLPGISGVGLWLLSNPRASRFGATWVLPALWMVFAAVIWANFQTDRAALSTAAVKREWIASYRSFHNLKKANHASNFWIYHPAPDAAWIDDRLKFLEEHRLSFFHP